jgi:FkbM family methyltransferase
MIQTAKVTINGQEFTIRYPHSQLMEQVIQGVLSSEYPFLPFLRDEPGVILDVGANIGCASILFRVLYPRSTILAFEPGRETFDFLRSNTCGLAEVRTFPFGLFDRDGTAKLYRGSEASVTNSVSRSVLNSGEYEEVALRRISSVLDEQAIGAINLLKLDTEGAEVPILRDIEDRLDGVGAIFVEYHSERDRREIDHLLSERFILYGAKIHRCHLGVLAYVAREIVASQTPWEKMAITRPQL